MATRERKDVYKLPAGDRTLYWYGRAITAMRARPATDPTSWRYQAAIHGFDPASPFWSGVGTLPSSAEQANYWRQCQHGSWYFFPWHRMFLAHFEQMVRDAIAGMGGPSGWALPFWDYSDTANPAALTIPPAFTSGSAATNPLQMPPAGTQPGRVNTRLRTQDVSLSALASRVFVGAYTGGSPGFGGVVTSFNHLGSGHGLLEYTPHDFVHATIGGAMGDVETAGLDPIFWLHHANIDRLWQVWLNQGGGRANPTDSRWLTAGFRFHDSHRNPVVMTPAQVVDTRLVLSGYTYQGVHPLGAGDGGDEPSRELREAVCQGSMRVPVHLEGQTQGVTFDLDAGADAPHRDVADTWLNFEAVTGHGVAPAHDVYLNLPERCPHPDEYLLCGLPFFGSGARHMQGGEHTGIVYAVNITEMVETLRERGDWRPGQLRLQIVPRRLGQGYRNWHVTIGALSLYAQ